MSYEFSKEVIAMFSKASDLLNRVLVLEKRIVMARDEVRKEGRKDPSPSAV